MLEKLKFLNLSHSHYLSQTPDFSKLPNLEKLILKDCTSLFEVHESIGDLQSLILVNLEGCKSLKCLPRSFYKLKSLETLILSGCCKIDHLDDDLGELKSLKILLADNTAIKQEISIIAPLKNLNYVSLRGFEGSPREILDSYFRSRISPWNSIMPFNLLPDSPQGMNSPKECFLSDCNLSDEAIPEDPGSLCSLQSIDLQSNCTVLERMPNLSKISRMQTLSLTNFHKLVEIPGLDKLLKFIGILHMEGCNNITSTFKQSILQVSSLSQYVLFLFIFSNIAYINHALHGTGMDYEWIW